MCSVAVRDLADRDGTDLAGVPQVDDLTLAVNDTMPSSAARGLDDDGRGIWLHGHLRLVCERGVGFVASVLPDDRERLPGQRTLNPTDFHHQRELETAKT